MEKLTLLFIVSSSPWESFVSPVKAPKGPKTPAALRGLQHGGRLIQFGAGTTTVPGSDRRCEISWRQ